MVFDLDDFRFGHIHYWIVEEWDKNSIKYRCKECGEVDIRYGDTQKIEKIGIVQVKHAVRKEVGTQ